MKEFFSVINETTDISNEMSSFSTDEVDFELTPAQTLRVGFRKPFALIYFELSTPSTASAKLTATYENEDGNQSLEIIDETKGFTRSGFIKFKRPEDIVETEASSIKKMFVEIKTDIALDPGTKLKGVGVVFCNNQDLIDIRSNVIDKLNKGESLIGKISLAKDHIIREMNARGNIKIKTDPTGSLTSGSYIDEVNEFDFFNIEQMRLACAYKALALFFLEEKSDKEGDKWEAQGMRYEVTAGELLDAYVSRIDIDDDGKEDLDELNQTTTTMLSLD